MSNGAESARLLDRMRTDWNERARKDAYFYAGFLQQHQTETDFLASSRDVLPALEEEFPRLAALPAVPRRALEIGCGPGRLMLAMAPHFDEIHGVDVSDEMIALAKETLRGANAHVQLTSGADLEMYAAGHFDYVYSYVVFQHIPSREIVLNYLAEAQRVLKPGGVLRCQLRGAPPAPSELEAGADTWTGCWFTAGEVLQLAKARRFPLVALSGIGTQCMWTTFRKARPAGNPIPARITVLAVTSAAGQEHHVAARGPGAAVSLWVDGAPENISLADCLVCFNTREQTGCYLSPVSETGGCQMNALLPERLAPGVFSVSLKVDGHVTEGAHEITVVDVSQEQPQIVSITDGVNLASACRVETSSARVIIRNVPDPDQLSFSVSGWPVPRVWHECENAITGTHIFYLQLDPSRLPKTRGVLCVSQAGNEVASVDFDIAL